MNFNKFAYRIVFIVLFLRLFLFNVFLFVCFFSLLFSVSVCVQQATKIKHSTPDKVSQRNLNTDDDIFFDMDGLDTRDSNMPQVTQSDDEDDDDEDFGMDSFMKKDPERCD